MNVNARKTPASRAAARARRNQGGPGLAGATSSDLHEWVRATLYVPVVVVPRTLEEEVLRRAAEKVTKENCARRELLKGRTLRDVFNEYRVL